MPRLLSIEWPPSTPIRLAVLLRSNASMISAQKKKKRFSFQLWPELLTPSPQKKNIKKNKIIPHCHLTLAAGGKHEGVWVFLTHPVNHVNLLQCLSHGIFVLRLAGHVGRPELKEKRNTDTLTDSEGLWMSLNCRADEAEPPSRPIEPKEPVSEMYLGFDSHLLITLAKLKRLFMVSGYFHNLASKMKEDCLEMLEKDVCNFIKGVERDYAYYEQFKEHVKNNPCRIQSVAHGS